VEIGGDDCHRLSVAVWVLGEIREATGRDFLTAVRT
jgi:hypothetical protein